MLRRIEGRGWANPHSPHTEGREARALLETAREQVARLAGVSPAAVFFTSGGTEAAHAALTGLARIRSGEHRREVVISGLEHASMAAAATGLAREGLAVSVVPPGAGGVVEVDRFVAACGPHTAVAALIGAHNEFGTVQPVDEVAAALAGIDIALVVDAVQLPGRRPRILPAGDHVVGILSAHKFGGLAGAGAVIAAPDRRLVPLLAGGEQERGRRAGTPALALIAVMGAAATAVHARDVEDREAMERLRDRLEAHLREGIEGIEIIGEAVERLPNTTAALVEGVRGEDLVAALDLAGIAVSTGSACSTGSARPSAALLSMGYSPERAREMVRFSLGPETRADEIDSAAVAAAAAADRLRQHVSRARVAR